MVKRKKVEEDSLEKFFIAYGVIFDEFKNQDLSFWIYYLLFILRRVSMAIFTIYIQNPVLQLMSIATFSVCILFYVSFTRCFKKSVSNYFMIFNEVIYLLIVILLLKHLLISSNYTYDYISNTVIAAWALNIFYGLALLSSKLISRVFKQKSAKIGPKPFSARPEIFDSISHNYKSESEQTQNKLEDI